MTLITGGCGFIGTNLVLRLLGEEVEVVVVDNFSSRGPEALREACREHAVSVPSIRKLDIRDQKALRHAASSVRTIVHLAAFTDVRLSTQQPEKGFKTNIRGTFNVLETARKISSVDQVVFASSNAAVGEIDGAVDESRVPAPISPYGADKLYGEALLSAYAETYGLRTVALRFANAYGPYSYHKNSVVHKFVRRALREEPLEVYGDGQQTRDFIHVSDVVRAIHLAMSTSSNRMDVYQVGTGVETSINDLAEMVQSIAAEKGVRTDVRHTDPRPGEIRSNYCSTRKIKQELGWEPRIDLASGLREVWDCYSQSC